MMMAAVMTAVWDELLLNSFFYLRVLDEGFLGHIMMRPMVIIKRKK